MTIDAHARSLSSARSRKKYPEKSRARNKVQRAVKNGTLVRPDECERCGEECRPEASHDDYSQPLVVEWLCRPCHARKDLSTHCPQGHEWTPANTAINREGARRCRKCSAEATRRWRDANR